MRRRTRPGAGRGQRRAWPMLLTPEVPHDDESRTLLIRCSRHGRLGKARLGHRSLVPGEPATSSDRRSVIGRVPLPLAVRHLEPRRLGSRPTSPLDIQPAVAKTIGDD